jgi:hypothetical protein
MDLKKFVEHLEDLKKAAFAVYLLAAIIILGAVFLILEAGLIVEVWELKFGRPAAAAMIEESAGERSGCSQACSKKPVSPKGRPRARHAAPKRPVSPPPCNPAPAK